MVMYRSIKERQRGFTLIELMTSIFIVACLASILIPNMRRAILRSHVCGCQQNLKNIATALNSYAIDDPNRNYPGSLDETVPNYIANLPTCPSAQVDTYSPGYEVSSDRKNFTVHCNGTNHNLVKLGQDEPYYALTRGLYP